MTKLRRLFCILLLCLASSGAASAAPSQPETFWIAGHTTSFDWQPLPGGLTAFYLTAAGTATGYLHGSFTLREWTIVAPGPAARGGPCRGINGGTLTITSDSDSRAFLAFAGRSDCEIVWGGFRVLQGTGSYAGLQGQGTYIGSAGLLFAVRFTAHFPP